MLKSMLVGTVALALAGSGVALAQQGRPAQPSPPAAQVSPPQGSPQQSAPQQTTPQQQAAPAQQSPSAQQQSDALATAEGRIAELRARLSLTPDQEKNWPAFEQAYRDFARVRSERWADLRAQQRSDNPVENFQIWADFASRRVNGMKRLADAAVPLYQALDQNQQRRFMDQIYAWHPRLARLSNRIAAGGRDGGGGGGGDDDGGRGPGGWHGDFHGRYGMGRGDGGGWQGRGYGPGAGGCMGPRSGWRDRDGDRGSQDGPGSGMGQRGWRDRGDGDWGGERGRGPGMGQRGGWQDRGGDQQGRGYGRGPGPGMGQGSGGRDRDDDDEWQGGAGGAGGGGGGGRGRWSGGADEERF
jgi:hypothetical protein